ncbi:2-phospho-L-lactate guanylyltransferase [Nakamurella flavida]|uniref:2-phospho-L-lactate guanylyltransferase n=1 Tax=Nakamurella flavida TaxID=363630 RepID=A0A938YQK9_9ACTN|nr:2-phospho-L-lactate guanylyltransferase [Nakamurella flavida]MBM9477428.1 2-phospho-L-lactate guanylyltransferase [Nakamurella flavida]MDP9777361.1 2-phospho-L-lactate guanylyltransferase [Nakamurella flavida]
MTAADLRPPPTGWTVVVPVKSTSRGKSRLDVDPAVRPGIALAMARDTLAAVTAARSVGAVLVVAGDPADVPALIGDSDRAVLLDPVDDLNAAIALGVRQAAARGATRIAVLPGDLPSLRPVELDAALTLAAHHPLAVVPDQDTLGTTLLTATDVRLLVPAFGLHSFRRHQDAGAVPLDLPAGSGLRRDVDEIDDLLRAGGTNTLAALRDAGLLPCAAAAR